MQDPPPQPLLALFLAGLVLMAAPVSSETLRPLGPVIVRANTAALLLSDQDGGAVRMGVLPVAHPVPSGHSGDPTVTVLVEIEGRSLIGDHQSTVLRAHVFVYVVGSQQETLALATHRLRLDLDRHRQILEDSGLRILLTLAPPPGEHRVRVYVRGESGAFGLASSSIEIPDPRDNRPRILPPLIPPPPNRWLTVVSEKDEAALIRAWGWLGSPTLFPASSHPVLATGTHRDVVLAQRGVPSSTMLPGARLEMAEGSTRELQLEGLKPIAEAPAGMAAWRAALAPTEFEGGRYRLSAHLDGQVSPTIRAFVLPDDTLVTDTVVTDTVVTDTVVADTVVANTWPQVDADGLSPRIELPPAVASPDDSGQPMRDQEIIAGYLRALHQLTVADQDAGLRHLYELETRVLGIFESDALKKLEGIEAETLSALTQGRESALLPVILLHAQAIRGYRAAGRSALVGHSEHMVQRLVRTWVERVPGEDVQQDATRVLFGIAAELRGLGTVTRAQRVYRHALDIVPGDGDIALALAAIEEKWGRPAEVVAILGDLAPAGLAPEARLRLAMAHQRLGQRSKAEGHFRRLIGRSGVPWIQVLAYEELAKVAMNRGNFEAAAKILRQALTRWPDHRTLRIQQAHVLDRTGRSEEATKSLEEIGGQVSPPNAAPLGHPERFRYNEWPRAKLEDGRREMEERARNLRPELQAALEALMQGQSGGAR